MTTHLNLTGISKVNRLFYIRSAINYYAGYDNDKNKDVQKIKKCKKQTQWQCTYIILLNVFTVLYETNVSHEKSQR